MRFDSVRFKVKVSVRSGFRETSALVLDPESVRLWVTVWLDRLKLGSPKSDSVFMPISVRMLLLPYR